MSWDILGGRYAAVCTEALVHFVWQGAVLGIAGYAALRSAAQPRTRYAIACVTLILMALAPVVTIAINVRGNSRGGAAPSEAAAWPITARSPLPPDTPIDWRRFVLPAWLAGVLILAVRAAGGWTFAVWRVKQGRVRASQEVEDAVRALAQRFGVSRAIRVFAASGTGVPAVFGWIRPVLLVPVTAITGLGAGDLRAILAHELAHIARHDFAVNCLQSAVEVLLFYHPAVWWISRRIREEREMCCDEAAVEICGDPVRYSRALLALEESRQSFVLAANGGPLKSRIERLLLRREPASTLGAAATALLAVTGCAIAIGAVPVVAMPPVPELRVPTPAATVPPITFELLQPSPERNRGSDASARRIEMQYAYAPSPQTGPPRQQTQYSTTKKGSRPGIPAAARRPVLLIMPRDQVDQYLLLQDDAARDRFIEQFWAGRPPGDRREHERRVRYAEERFGGDTTRGHTYIKEGPPDEIEAHPNESWEIWTYQASGQKYTFAGQAYDLVTIEYGNAHVMHTIGRVGGPPDDEGEITIVSVRDDLGREVAGVTPGDKPYYPRTARHARISGDVVVQGRAGADGKVQTVSVISGPPLLINAAQAAAKNWMFREATQFEAALRFTLRPPK